MTAKEKKKAENTRKMPDIMLEEGVEQYNTNDIIRELSTAASSSMLQECRESRTK